MAGRIRNRHELRKQAEHAEAVVDDIPASKPKKPAKKATTPRKRASTKKVPPRMWARWGVFDGGMKQVAIFGYNQRAAADDKVAELLARNKGVHFVQLVKEPMPVPAVEEPTGG